MYFANTFMNTSRKIISWLKTEYLALFLFSIYIQEIEAQVLRLDKIKLLSKLEKCKRMEGAKNLPEKDRVLNGFGINTIDSIDSFQNTHNLLFTVIFQFSWTSK